MGLHACREGSLGSGEATTHLRPRSPNQSMLVALTQEVAEMRQTGRSSAGEAAGASGGGSWHRGFGEQSAILRQPDVPPSSLGVAACNKTLPQPGGGADRQQVETLERSPPFGAPITVVRDILLEVRRGQGPASGLFSIDAAHARQAAAGRDDPDVSRHDFAADGIWMDPRARIDQRHMVTKGDSAGRETGASVIRSGEDGIARRQSVQSARSRYGYGPYLHLDLRAPQREPARPNFDLGAANVGFLESGAFTCVMPFHAVAVDQHHPPDRQTDNICDEGTAKPTYADEPNRKPLEGAKRRRPQSCRSAGPLVPFLWREIGNWKAGWPDDRQSGPWKPEFDPLRPSARTLPHPTMGTSHRSVLQSDGHHTDNRVRQYGWGWKHSMLTPERKEPKPSSTRFSTDYQAALPDDRETGDRHVVASGGDHQSPELPAGHPAEINRQVDVRLTPQKSPDRTIQPWLW